MLFYIEEVCFTEFEPKFEGLSDRILSRELWSGFGEASGGCLVWGGWSFLDPMILLCELEVGGGNEDGWSRCNG